MTATSLGDVRCPFNPKRLFARVVDEDNLWNIACRDCARNLREREDPAITLVLHRFSLVGEYVDTKVVR